MRIDIVIPNYNGADLIEKNLPVLIKHIAKYNIGEVIISDDGSEEQNYNRAEEFINKIKKEPQRKIKLIRNQKNAGFSSNVDKGVEEAKSELILLINTDVTVQENFLDAVLQEFEIDENLFGVGLMDESIENDKTVLRGRGIAHWKKGFLLHSRGEVDKSDTFWVSGGSSVVRRELFEKLGGFDDLYDPFYWEDIDLSYRARKAGYHLRFENRSIVEHYHSKGAIKRYYTPSQVKKIAYRNQFIFVWKNITDLSLILSHLFWLPYHLLVALVHLDTAFMLGFTLAAFRLPAIIKKRKKQKQFYKKTDTFLLKSQ